MSALGELQRQSSTRRAALVLLLLPLAGCPDYGPDNRRDIFQLPSIATQARAVAGLFDAARVQVAGNGSVTLVTEPASQLLCAGEKFRDQPRGPFCTAFLVGQRQVATALHCVNGYIGVRGGTSAIRVVFGFEVTNLNGDLRPVTAADVYRVVDVAAAGNGAGGGDWAVLNLDRQVTGRSVPPRRTKGMIAPETAVYAIGHPLGLPLKYTDSAKVRSTTPLTFISNLDVYGGSSGSPVFNTQNVVEGILVSGEADFEPGGGCKHLKVCSTNGCAGETAVRILNVRIP